jgi:hypothetical protein
VQLTISGTFFSGPVFSGPVFSGPASGRSDVSGAAYSTVPPAAVKRSTRYRRYWGIVTMGAV